MGVDLFWHIQFFHIRCFVCAEEIFLTMTVQVSRPRVREKDLVAREVSASVLTL